MSKAALDQLRIEREPEGSETRSRAWIWLIAVLVVAGAAAAWYGLGRDQTTSVTTALVQELEGTAADTVLNASGYVNARRQATVSSKVTGKVVDIPIEEGMAVEEGQVLARLDDTNARAALALSIAQVETARTAEKETQALLEEARLNLERAANLAQRNLASDAELDRNRAQTQSLEARLERNRADVKVAQRQVEIYRQQLEDTIIRAPFTGVVVGKNAQPGEMISPVSAGGGFTRTGIGTIVDMSSLEIEIDVNEAYINRVTAGQEVVATLDAYPDWQIPGHVIAIIPTADRQRATVGVRVGFDELDPRILPDMGVNVGFRNPGGEVKAVRKMAVPVAAVRDPDNRPYVLVVNDGVIERRAVNTGGRRGDKILIDAGLAAGERVVVDGPDDLAEGMKVVEAAS
ncbi:efflux RND transporter periplasmic adaptor subunit [Elongatibacter sediminis]|uniref:Efflux RND transporter periplasmic adaptor subunit n=1 Tax=Elongatibacter sediminis TaxID=3119006 RepID=A0AAW9RC66_9GAMM